MLVKNLRMSALRRRFYADFNKTQRFQIFSFTVIGVSVNLHCLRFLHVVGDLVDLFCLLLDFFTGLIK